MKPQLLYVAFAALVLCPTISVGQTPTTITEFIESIVEMAETDFAVLNRETLAQAEPDECFFGIGDANNQFVPTGVDCADCEAAGGEAKTNQAYVWGLAKTDNNLWYGTGPNVHCLVIGGFLGTTGPTQTESYVCEFGQSQLAGTVGAAVGDYRPPRMYRYMIGQKSNVDITPADPLVNTTLGIRSTGASDDIVFYAGPGLGPSGLAGINMFAFDANTGAFLGAQNLPAYANIRKWYFHDGELYTAVGNTGGGGSVLRWTGSTSSPFQFAVVGALNSQGAELEVHEGRLFVTTWPSTIGALGGGLPTEMAELYMSPVIPAGGLLPAHAGVWNSIWTASDYEPDPVTAATYGGGALASFDGELYWGTMHVPFLSAAAHIAAYGPPTSTAETIGAVLGTLRPISIFRASNFSGTPNIEVLYGSPAYPVYTPAPLGGSWTIQPNNMGGQLPTYGLAGFGNPFNNYTWTMDTYEDKLYVGTMDFSYLLFGDLDLSLPMMLPFDCPGLGLSMAQCAEVESAYMTFKDLFNPSNYLGADLWRFDSGNERALPESLAGVGNNASYGIRTMIGDEDGLFLGMANPMNLRTCDDDDLGGWALMCLTWDGLGHEMNIPTLGEWAIIILSLLLLIIATVSIRQKDYVYYNERLL